MAEIINLRQARKRKRRAEKDARQPRRSEQTHGPSGGDEAKPAGSSTSLDAKRLEAHRRDRRATTSHSDDGAPADQKALGHAPGPRHQRLASRTQDLGGAKRMAEEAGISLAALIERIDGRAARPISPPRCGSRSSPT